MLTSDSSDLSYSHYDQLDELLELFELDGHTPVFILSITEDEVVAISKTPITIDRFNQEFPGNNLTTT